MGNMYDFRREIAEEVYEYLYHSPNYIQPTRRQQFELMQWVGFTVVPYGITYSSRLSDDTEIVVYTDEMAHNGEGKEIGRLGDWRNLKPARLFSVFIAMKKNPVSRRWLQIGNKSFGFCFESSRGWQARDNPESKITLEKYSELGLSRLPKKQKKIDLENVLPPIWSADFVVGLPHEADKSRSSKGIYAIDFNLRPEIPQSVMHYLRDQDPVAEIEDYLRATSFPAQATYRLLP